jgi:transposase
MIHKAREMSIKNRTAQANQIRGMLHEYGVVIPRGLSQIRQVLKIIEAKEEQLSVVFKQLLETLYKQFKLFDEQVKSYDQDLTELSRQNPLCKAVQGIPGVGPLIASAIVATIGDTKVFKNGREVSAWLGLTPKQFSSGNKIVLGGISKRGDRYMRKLLIQGARTVVAVCEKKQDKRSQWVASKKERCGFNKASVALANKNARMIWAMMTTGECYRSAEKMT